MTLGDYCAECGRKGAGPRQLCRDCLPLYPIDDIAPAPGADHPPGHDECQCPACISDVAGIVPCMRKSTP